jgi:hypothetical protein
MKPIRWLYWKGRIRQKADSCSELVLKATQSVRISDVANLRGAILRLEVCSLINPSDLQSTYCGLRRK